MCLHLIEVFEPKYILGFSVLTIIWFIHIEVIGRRRKLTISERSLPSFRKSFVDVRVAFDRCALSPMISFLLNILIFDLCGGI